jgi:hypothetical protein
MAHTALEDSLQRKIDRTVHQHRVVYSAVLGVTSASGGFRWAGAAGAACADKPEPTTREPGPNFALDDVDHSDRG